MQLTFIGHHSWLISHGETAVLIDPVLNKSFGNNERAIFEIYPPRLVCQERLPKIDAVVLTNEHAGHFDPTSLSKLPPGTLVIIGHTAPSPVRECLMRLGMRIASCVPGERNLIGELTITLYRGNSKSAFWESRVHHAVITSASGETIFIQSDALVSEFYLTRLRSGQEPPLTAVVLTNNSQIVPNGDYGPFDNLLPILAYRRGKSRILASLSSVLLDAPAELHRTKYICLSGSGYTIQHKAFGPFLWSDPKELEGLCHDLWSEQTVLSLNPGELIDITQGGRRADSDWIIRNDDRRCELQRQQREFLADSETRPLRPVLCAARTRSELAQAERFACNELNEMARFILPSPVGEFAVALNGYLLGPLDSRRIVFRLLREPWGHPAHYALDFNTASFFQIEIPTSDLPKRFPFGVEMYLQDLVGLAQGDLSIWDLATCAMRQWYIGDPFESIVAFLFSYYSEQIRPDLFAKQIGRALNGPSSGTIPPSQQRANLSPT